MALHRAVPLGTACTEREPMTAPSRVAFSAASQRPLQGHYWAGVSDSALWQEIISSDSTLNVGLKLPGTERGVVRGRATVDRASWRLFVASIRADSSLSVRSVDSVRFPLVRVSVHDQATLSRIRQLPFVDFAEPAHIKIHYFSGCGSSDSWSSGGSSSGDETFGDALEQISSPTGGVDQVAAVYESGTGMNIPQSWKLTAGQGVTVGVTDTGVDTLGSSEFNSGYVSTGASAGRTFLEMSEYAAGQQPSCSHGTRIAGLAVGPRNGRSVVGAAYRANVVGFYQSNSEDPIRGNANDAIDSVVAHGAKVVIMAWGMDTGSDLLSNTIDDAYYNRDVMFVGAAGTCPIGSYCPRMDSAVFPASKEEVLAATGANHDGSRPGDMFAYGGKSGVLAYTNLATTGLQRSDLVNLAGSSAATGIVGGIATLVRAYNPQLTNRQAMDRLIRTSGSTCGAPHAWTEAMVNASAAVGGPCVYYLLGPSTYYIHDNTLGDTAVQNSWILVARSFASGFVPGGSGSYRADWTLAPGAHAVGAVQEGDITDASSNVYWRSLTSLRFKPAFDGNPYVANLSVNVTDNQLSTVDTRQLSVLVCQTSTNCASTTRPWPAYAVINGPSYINQEGYYAWTTTYQGPAEPYTVQWDISYDGGTTFGPVAQGTTFSMYVSSGDVYNVVLRTTVTSQTGATGVQLYSVTISAGCDPSQFIC